MHDQMVMIGATQPLVPALFLTFAVLLAICVKNVPKFRALGVPLLLLTALVAAHLGPFNPLIGIHNHADHPCCLAQLPALEPVTWNRVAVQAEISQYSLYKPRFSSVIPEVSDNKSPPLG